MITYYVSSNATRHEKHRLNERLFTFRMHALLDHEAAPLGCTRVSSRNGLLLGGNSCLPQNH